MHFKILEKVRWLRGSGSSSLLNQWGGLLTRVLAPALYVKLVNNLKKDQTKYCPKDPICLPNFYNFLTAFLSFFGSFCPHCEGKFDRVPEACRYFTNYSIPTKRPLWSIEAKVQNKHDDLNAGSWVVCRLRS